MAGWCGLVTCAWLSVCTGTIAAAQCSPQRLWHSSLCAALEPSPPCHHPHAIIPQNYTYTPHTDTPRADAPHTGTPPATFMSASCTLQCQPHTATTYLHLAQPAEQAALRHQHLANGPHVVGGHPEPHLRAAPKLLVPPLCALVGPPQLRGEGMARHLRRC